MSQEAKLERTEIGTVPASPGWFVVNVADTPWMESDQFGSGCRFEGGQRFENFGVNVRVLGPGQPACMYHGEDQQEAFLVLQGECLLLIDGEERKLSQWDFVHCPANVDHVFVGAGDGPCAILMIGNRREGEKITYPVSELARKHGASVETETNEPREAYASVAPPKMVKGKWPL